MEICVLDLKPKLVILVHVLHYFSMALIVEPMPSRSQIVAVVLEMEIFMVIVVEKIVVASTVVIKELDFT